MNNKIKYLKKVFLNNNYELSDLDVLDLEIQLQRKPIQIYLMAIEWLIKNKYSITYQNVKELIKIDIKIRNNIRNIITSLEESIRVIYIDMKADDYSDLSKFNIESKETLNNVIKTLEKNDYSEITPLLNDIRNIRNDVSHLVYFLIFEKLDDTLIKMNNIRKIKHIDKKVFNKYIKSINDLKNKCKTFDK